MLLKTFQIILWHTGILVEFTKNWVKNETIGEIRLKGWVNVN